MMHTQRSSKEYTAIKVLLQVFQCTPALRKQSGDSPSRS